MSRRVWTCAFVIALIGANLIGLHQGFAEEKNTTPALSKDAAMWAHRVTGKIVSIKNGQLEVETREKRTVQVDASEATRNKRVNEYSQGSLVTIYGAYGANGALRAQSIQRAKNLASAWPEDR